MSEESKGLSGPMQNDEREQMAQLEKERGVTNCAALAGVHPNTWKTARGGYRVSGAAKSAIRAALTAAKGGEK